ncbi:MAG: hypothetical protein QM741_00550 [Rudaea sp.]|uniref:hypothetical protein n=1 Tax=Rudaea sp. TaxID=2136325 RepID=UPI0039E26214
MTNRREFLRESAPLLAAPLLFSLFTREALADSASQGAWRYCRKCGVLFWNGIANKGHCPAGGGHEASGFHFVLDYGDLPEIPKAQINWRFCDKCFEMFYDGSADKGRCVAGGGHRAQGFRFRLPHDVAGDGNHQDLWRFCQKCHAMFYDGFPGKGVCPFGGGHSAYGYLFVLAHDLPAAPAAPPEIHLRSNLYTDGWAPIGGWVDIVMKRNGDYVFAGHVHNSGGLNIRYSLAAVVTTPSGQTFGYGVAGHRVDGTETVFGRHRDHNWSVAKNDPRIAANWNSVAQGTLSWRLVASSTLVSGIQKFIEDAAREEFNKLRQSMSATGGGQIANFYLNLLTTL